MNPPPPPQATIFEKQIFFDTSKNTFFGHITFPEAQLFIFIRPKISWWGGGGILFTFYL